MAMVKPVQRYFLKQGRNVIPSQRWDWEASNAQIFVYLSRIQRHLRQLLALPLGPRRASVSKTGHPDCSPPPEYETRRFFDQYA